MTSLPVVVCEVCLDGVPIGQKALRSMIKAFFFKRAVEPFDMSIVIRFPDP